MQAAKLEHSDLVKHQVGIVQQFREFWIENHLCDVVLKSTDGTEHGAHAAVLSATSMPFKKMLTGPFLEADRVQQGHPVEIDASKATLVALLDFIYGGQPEVDLEAGLELLRLAEAYDLPKLASAIETGFRASLDGSGALRVLQEAHGLDSLKTACEEIVTKDFESCIQQPEFGKLSATQLARILKRSDLSVSREEVVLQGLFKWLSVSEDGNTSLGMLLQLVDFQSISVENLLRLGRFTLSGPAGSDLNREVNEALRVRPQKRTQSSNDVQPKRRCLQHWSPDLGASSSALGREVLPVPANSLCWHEGAIYYACYFSGNILCWQPDDAAANAQRVVGEGAFCELTISPSGEMFVADAANQKLVSFQNGSGQLILSDFSFTSLFCSPSGVVYVLHESGTVVAKLVGSTLQTLIAAETLPEDLQFSAIDIFDSAWLQIQVLVRKSGSFQEVLQAEATVPLQRGGWPQGIFNETPAVERLSLLPLENFAHGRYAQVPLFPENSRAAGMMEGVDAVAIPGAVGSMKCSYCLSRKQEEKPKAKAEVLEDLQSTEEETEVLPEPEEEKTRKAAAHTHDHGYRKWETFVQEMEAKPKRAAPVYEMMPEEVQESDYETLEELRPSAPSVSQLGELKEDITGPHCMLHLYVHDAQLLESAGELDLEVLLGQNVAFHLSPGSSSSFQQQFRVKKELPIELPRHSRLQLRLRDQSSQVLGSTVVDLQDRRLVETLREKEEVAECRQLWSKQLRCVGSLQMWLRVTPLQGGQATLEPENDLWPLPYRQDRVELRVILHEVLFSMATAAKEAVAAVELEMPVERLHRCRLPSPQYSDVRPLFGLQRGNFRARISFEWRCSLSLTMLLPSTQKRLLISIFDPKTWQLLGNAEFLIDGVLSQVAETSGRQDINDIPVLTRNHAGVCGSLSLAVRAVPWSLAEDFPLQPGRGPSAVPSFENRDPRSVAEDLCAERLVCDPPETRPLGVPPNPPSHG
eukprot:s237_g12.t1